MITNRRIILSCEHAGNRVPAHYRYLFEKEPDIMDTHRGYDIGIAPIARQLQKTLGCPLCIYEYTRLLIDVNRTRRQSQFSEFSKALSEQEKQSLIDAYDSPYKKKLKQLIAEQIKVGPVLHWSLHSFTPVLKGQIRNADIGILYDPARTQETAYAKALQTRLQQATRLRIRRNFPYLGRADGIATWLRKYFPQGRYLGIEIELNQAFPASLSAKEQADFVKKLARLIYKT